MFTVKCPSCKSPNVKKNGKRNGVQLYKCTVCFRQFNARKQISPQEVWELYQNGKQTIREISKSLGVGEMTVKRRLQSMRIGWKPPVLRGRHGIIHIDATYFGRNNGVIVALESSGEVLYVKCIKHERILDYTEAVEALVSQGYGVDGIVIDGIQQLFSVLSRYPIQMCQYHMAAIIRRKLTQNPRTTAGKDLKALMRTLPEVNDGKFSDAFDEWQRKHASFLKEKTVCEDGRWIYTHKRLRSAAQSLRFYMPYLFTHLTMPGMPNTNNKIEGVFSDLKRNLRNHSGISNANREKFIYGFFLAWNKAKQE